MTFKGLAIVLLATLASGCTTNGFSYDLSSVQSTVLAFLRWIDRHNGSASAAATVMIAVLTIALIRVGRRQAKHMQETVDATLIAANAAKASADFLPKLERAYVVMGLNTISQGATWQPIAYKIEVVLLNYGRTPAVIRKIHRDVKGNTWVIPDKPVYDEFCTAHVDKIIAASSEGPGKWPVGRMETAYTQQVIFVGYVEYSDIFNQTHVSRICARVNHGEYIAPMGGDAWNAWE